MVLCPDSYSIKVTALLVLLPFRDYAANNIWLIAHRLNSRQGCIARDEDLAKVSARTHRNGSRK